MLGSLLQNDVRGGLMQVSSFWQKIFTLLALAAFSLTSGFSSLLAKGKSLPIGLTDLEAANLRRIQEELASEKKALDLLSERARDLVDSRAPEEDFSELYQEAKRRKGNISKLEEEWRSLRNINIPSESEAMWHMPDATVAQLVTDFGSQDTVYIVPPDIGATRIGLIGNVSVPKESWEGMLEWVLAEQGIGVQRVNAYCKQLFHVSQGPLRFSKILSKEEDLLLIRDSEVVCFLLDTKGIDTKATGLSLEKMLSSVLVQVKPFRTSIALIGRASDVQKGLQIAYFLLEQGSKREFRVVPLTKIAAQDMEAILRSALGNPLSWGHSLSFSNQTSELEGIGLQVVPLMSPGGLFLVGSKEEVERAAQIMQKIEKGLAGPAKREIIRYVVKHTDPVELGKVLAKICKILTTATPLVHEDDLADQLNEAAQAQEEETGVAPLVVPGGLANLSEDQRGSTWGDYNVVVDMKTNTLFLAIETYLSSHIRELIKKLDVPEKMVRIDFILFEKTLTERGESGISLLSLGPEATTADTWGMRFPSSSSTSLRHEFGILQFFLKSSSELWGIPPFDLAFNFLVGQEDIQIHANPSLLTMNGTSAVINLVEETSINVGQTAVPSGNSTVLKDSYVRAQYGIKIRVKPVIHEEENERYITMDCDLTFESQRGGVEGRPEIHTRNIKNLCRIKDQESVIVGGLRQKDIEDRRSGLPVLGELPLFRTFFGYNAMSDRSTETFVLIRPQIIDSPSGEMYTAQIQALRKRPGDLLPLPLKRQGRRTEGLRARLPQSLRLLFGR
ncbi:type II secretion system protein GspD [Candidatus Similichlamydia laticola]|uniref:General secretion pathway protein D n=1 Tax=Candidatus Similichlamydia laticola TaxID=2170265 RepID=A0A369K9A1_9BACT|nr:hypothetical protein [Candidatus Similichlamydia laticola]RDB31169.1 General secretion pathway protein D [Candidatus Similichlamydia laticola]